MTGRFVASSPDFFQKSAASRREADLTRQIAHEQFKEAFGVGMACTKAVSDERNLNPAPLQSASRPASPQAGEQNPNPVLHRLRGRWPVGPEGGTADYGHCESPLSRVPRQLPRKQGSTSSLPLSHLR
jgi:hypothetical protein